MQVSNLRRKLSLLPVVVILTVVSLVAHGQGLGNQTNEEGQTLTLPTANFKAIASSNSEKADLAIDGDPNTRWTSSQGQRPSQVFQIDLGDVYEFNQLSLFHSSPDEGPAQFRVAVSPNGKSWWVVSRGVSGGELTIARFPSLVARHIRIVQKGWKVNHKWSIDEILVKNLPTSEPELPPISPAIIPIDLDVLPTDAEASNFLTASTFGPTLKSINELTELGYSDWFIDQLNKPITYIFPTINPIFADTTNYKWEGLARTGWYRRAIFGEDQLRQRAAFALSQIFVISTEPRDWMFKTHLQARYMDIMQEGAFGNFRELLEEVTYSPLMGLWLTYIGNQKANPETGSVPDENFAREIMQLFTIGLDELGNDGKPILNNLGQATETYDLEDISGLSKVFTGLWWSGKSFGQGFSRPNDEVNDPQRMVMHDSYHSQEEKRFLGHTIPANTGGNESIKQALDVLFAHPNVGPFISKQLIQRLTTSNPSGGYVSRVTRVFNRGSYVLPDGRVVGSGTRGDLAPVWAAILLDQEARTSSRFDTEGWGKVREPLVRFLHWARAAGINSAKVTRTQQLERGAAHRYLGQDPYRSKTVFNFFRPGYVAAGTFTGSAGLIAPELQIITSATAINYANFMQGFLLRDSGRHWVGSYRDQMSYAGNPDALASHLDITMTNGRMTDRTRQRIIESISSISNHRDRVQLAMLLVVNSQEYNTQQ